MLDNNRFWSFTKKDDKNPDCLIWTGPTNEKPVYGIYPALGGRLIAHRVAYEISVGELPPHSHVGRICENPLCVAPKHLFLQNANKSANPSVDAKRKIAAQVVERNGCWIWKGKAPKCIQISTGLKTLPRAVYEIYNGEISRGKEVSRVCHEKECLNPEHLVLIDRAKLGKSNSKLNLEQVQEIRKLAHTGEYGLMELADKFKTSRQTIYTVVYNLGWHDENYVPPAKMPRRSRFCRKGHPMSGENVELIDGIRKCRICQAEVEVDKKPRKTVEERFWEKIHKSADGCWDWTAYSYGYWGYFNINRVPQLAHRVAYELTHGDIPEGAKVLHTCDNTLCCNPAHLFLQQDNKKAAK